MHVKVWVANLGKENASSFEDVAAGIEGVTAVETWKGRAEMNVADDHAKTALAAALRNAGFELEDEGEGPAAKETEERGDVRHLLVDGMTCHSCEVTIERKFRK